MAKKVFVFLPDGVGLRNFAFTDFKEVGEKKRFDITYWNNTPFELEKELGFAEVKLQTQKIHPLTTIFTRARKRAELNFFDKKFKETVYNTYNFPQSYNGPINFLKSSAVDFLVKFCSNQKGIDFIRNQIKKLERKSAKYQLAKSQLETYKPDFIFCTNQRPSQAIAPILAAQDLKILTATFIFSWDNLPKATTLVETDYYFVWSNHMKAEVLKYCPYVSEKSIFVTGTPQFQSHFDTSIISTKEEFYAKYNLDFSKNYICYSGDDIVTSPLDQHYVEDLAKSVRELNAKGYNLGIIYRKCPVDFTDRYHTVLKQYQDVIVSIDPLWRPVGKNWDEIMPTKEDFALQATICERTLFVANVASSMVFDFVAHKKSCLFFDYEQPQLKYGIRDIGQNYDYIHFRSMPSKNAAVWCKNKFELTEVVRQIVDNEISNVVEGTVWFEKIVGTQPTKSSEKIWEEISKII
jgi:hypothetical protein